MIVTEYFQEEVLSVIRVKRSRSNTDQVSRCAASGLVEPEAVYRTIKSFRKIKSFSKGLKKKREMPESCGLKI
jgi:hypothetical protein